jgi:hypothetical protein
MSTTNHGNKWTILNGRQQKNGSWKDVAIKHFKECKVMASTNGCKTANCEQLEEVACEIICEQQGMEVITLEE